MTLWPFEEAAKVRDRIDGRGKSEAIFETGYGPSGLPHLGTFGEVLRTSWVQKAFREISDTPSRIIVFSDDMDGLRKAPDNVPNKAMLDANLNMPLTSIPDPFGKYESFGHHNNAMLRSFLDRFGFEYEFASATEYYRVGMFDATLRLVMEHYDEIMQAVLSTLREQRSANYSPFLPIHPLTGKVMQVPILVRDIDAGKITWCDPGGDIYVTSIYGGACKLQWKADWAMRWHALGVDYEMSGKDLIDSVKLSQKICSIIGQHRGPEVLTYELFLDEAGHKVSKSKGNGISIEEWLRYGPNESLAQFLFNTPKRAKKIHYEVIARMTDEFLSNAAKPMSEENPTWFIGANADSDVSFAMLLNIANVADANESEIVWGFLRSYNPALSPETHPFLNRLVGYAVDYYTDRIKPSKAYRAPTDEERPAISQLAATLRGMPSTVSADEIQQEVFEIGKRYGFETKLRLWFSCLYQVLLGQQEGPRFGAFAKIYGIENTIALIENSLARE